MDRRLDLTMFAGFHVAALISAGGDMPNLTFEHVDRLIGEYVDAIQPVDPDEKEMQFTFELRHKADMRAIKRWKDAHPDSEIDWPDHADMVVWLLEQLENPTET